MPIAVGHKLRLQRLAVQRLGLVELGLSLQLPRERNRGEACALATRALGLEPCAQKLDAQRIAVLVHALAAAVGCVLPRARAPPLLEAVHVDPLGGAAAGAWLHERAIVFIQEALPARLLLDQHCHERREECGGEFRPSPPEPHEQGRIQPTISTWILRRCTSSANSITHNYYNITSV
eukprot:scaffold75136_cov63-Phaeocystis_antarctica.AAC.2